MPGTLVAVIALVVFGGGLAQGQTQFTEHSIQGALVQASDVSMADLDDDGDQDIAAVMDIGGLVVWFENDGSTPPSFTYHEILSIPGPRTVDTGDLDGDGDIDIATGLSSNTSAQDSALYWHENDGAMDPVFSSIRIRDTSTTVNEIQIADINGDDRLDILFDGPTLTEISWARNDGAADPVFTTESIFTSPDNLIGLHAADIDGDGDMDTFGVNYDGDAVHMFLNDGSASPVWTSSVLASTPKPYSVRTGDFDADGDMDVVTCGYTSNRIEWHENIGSATPAFETHIIDNAAIGAIYLKLADIDNDADLDIVAAHYTDDKFVWYENLGGAEPTFERHAVSETDNGPHRFEVGDLDSDGDNDLVVALLLGDEVKWYENLLADDAPDFTQGVIDSTQTDAISIDSLDYDGDGDQDIVAASIVNDEIAVYVNAGNGRDWSEVILDSSFDGSNTVEAADLDGDGDKDILAGSQNSNEVAWYVNSPTWPKRIISSSLARIVRCHAFDMDGDMDLDVLVSAHDSSTIAWFENTAGDGSAWTQHNVTTGYGSVVTAVAADYDGDGDMDVFGGRGTAGNAAWWENTDGLGTAWTQHTLTDVLFGTYYVKTADMDEDGDMDVVAAATNQTSQPGFGWYENDGAGNWTVNVLDTGFYGGKYVDIADVDGDGDLDALGAANGSGQVAWWENPLVGSASWQKHYLDDSFTKAHSVCAADFDGDTDTDIAAGSNSGEALSVWLNQVVRPVARRDILVDSPLFNALGDNFYVRVGDANNDGVNDILIGLHKDFATGKLGMVQYAGGAWDSGTVLLTAPAGYNGVQHIAVGDSQNDGVNRVLYNLHGQSNSPGALEAALISGATVVETVTVHSNSAHGGFYAGEFEDLDDDSDLEIYVDREETTEKFSVHEWNGSGYSIQEILGTGKDWAFRPVSGRFLNTAERAIIHSDGRQALNLLRYDGGYTSNQIFSVTTGTIYGFQPGEFDGNAGDEVFLVVTDSGSSDFYVLSNTTFTPTFVGSVPNTVNDICTADMNGDGVDEGYILVYDTGDVYQYTPGAGIQLIDNVPGVQWTECTRAMLPDSQSEVMVAVGVENGGNVRLRVYGEQWYDKHAFGSDVAGYWPLDGNALDYSGNGLHGVASNVVPVTGRLNQAYEFDGSTSQIQVPDYAQADALTFAAWIKVDALPAYPNMVFMRRANWQDQYLNLAVNGTAQVHALRNSGGSHNEAFSPDPAPLGEWVHLAGTIDATRTRVYINGQLANEEASGGDILWNEAVSAVMIGKNPGTGEVFDGLIDEMVIFNRALSKGEVAALGRDGDNNGIADYWEGASTDVETVTLPDNVEMKFNLIPAGSFVMGSSDDASWSWCYPCEQPTQTITIPYDFYMGTFEVTQAQWEAVMGSNPSFFSACGGDCPVEMVSWNMIQTYIDQLKNLGIGTFRLPSESEWEYAARAGTDTRFYWGDGTCAADSCTSCDLDDYAWWCGNSNSMTHLVGQKFPNAFGLFDMSGNVQEFVADDWHDTLNGIPLDGSPWIDNPRTNLRSLRSGRWNAGTNDHRSTNRDRAGLIEQDDNIGFRLVYIPASTPLYGDVNCDGNVDMDDVQHIAEVDSGLRGAVDCPANGDVNCDSVVDLVDALLIAQYVNGLRPSLPVCP